MVGDPFELRVDDAPALCPPGGLDSEPALDRLAEGGRVGDGGDAGDPLGELNGVPGSSPVNRRSSPRCLKNGRKVKGEHVLAAALDHVLHRFEDPRADRSVRDHEDLGVDDPAIEPVRLGRNEPREAGRPARQSARGRRAARAPAAAPPG